MTMLTGPPRLGSKHARLKILVAGRFASVPDQGGATWAVPQCALDLRELGYDVLLVDPCAPAPDVVAYFQRVVAGMGFSGDIALVHPDRRATGVPYAEVASWVSEADLHDARMYRAWRDRVERAGSPLGVLAAHDRATERLLALPSVLIHGDLYPSNVLVDTGSPLAIWPVDWELIGRGPAMLYLAALVSGWAPGTRDAMACAYLGTAGYPAWPSSWEEALDAARLRLCVQWLGAPTGWVLSSAHAHDWMVEALDLAQPV